ncbi:hypothetical protein HY642_05875 [Candidatus Woesearchaeota archaeon]|nr:hypothetical protein [Candidatus Woesearchaeota archaeon]
MKRVWLVALLVLIASCAKGTERTGTDWRTGTQGLVITFEPQQPPSQLYDDQEFNAVVRVENKGAFGVGSAGDRVYLSGFAQNIITGIPTNGIQLPKIGGKTQYSQGRGETDFVTFKGALRHVTDPYPPTILATACYGYETIATGTMCIDPDPYSVTSKQKVCTPGSATGLGGGQGGPVAVTAIEQEPARGRTRIKITISNAGNGEVFKAGGGYLSKCSPFHPEGLGFDEKDFVQLVDVRVGPTDSIRATCKPTDQGSVRLIDGRTTVYCDYTNIRGSSAFTTPLSVTLRYGYRTAVFRTVNILPSS